jgi:hypothetical protein
MMLRQAEIKAQNRRGALIMVGCVGVLAAVGWGLWQAQPPAREAATGCLSRKLSDQADLVIADTSDGFGKTQLAMVQAAIAKRAEELPHEDWLAVYVFDGQAKKAAPDAGFERCKGSDGAAASTLTSTASQIKRAHETQWRAPLAKALERLAEPAKSDRSELVQYIADVTGMAAYKPKASMTRVVLFSNLEEHGEVSFYQRKPKLDAAAFEAYFKRIMKDRLQTVSLDIVYVPSPTTTPELTKRTKAAWAQALTALGATFTIKDL